jgi:hypothetical protein
VLVDGDASLITSLILKIRQLISLLYACVELFVGSLRPCAVSKTLDVRMTPYVNNDNSRDEISGGKPKLDPWPTTGRMHDEGSIVAS